MNNLDLTLHLFLQIAVILLVCRGVGWVAAKFGQPQVVAEMIAGVALGPSLFGLWLPEWQQSLFPWDPTQTTRDSQSYLYPISQLGLALYMFVVGMEFRIDIVRQHFRSSLAVSIAGMLVPFVLGSVLAWFFVRHTSMFMPQTGMIEAMLFLGASLCITAFPMLARIIHTKGLAGTRMGTVAIGAGAIDDAAAWCLLALVLASFDDNFSLAYWSIGGGIAFVLTAVIVIRPLLSRLLGGNRPNDNSLHPAGLAIALACMSLGAWFTDMIHLHAVFGAFIIGTVIPRGAVTRELIQRIEPLTVAILLPLFFTYSGLNTRITVLDSAYLWGLCGIVLLIAVIGKGAACAMAAWKTGVPGRESLGIGVLMNARGLMELIVINIGLQRGLISEELFVVLVLMAIVTTLMTSPIFDWLVQRSPDSSSSSIAPRS
ncbi:cation:proton antiporter [Novipirellula rosea]|uniref:Cation:proton antiporter n=1 Tax=Novipirellula rosea TaxID=1031540 RepID=A0ABP8NGH9_9BACT